MPDAKKENIEQKPTLYLIPTPIGNMDDITIRALKILNQVDIIACEDTRHSGQLLKSYNISPAKLQSYHEYNEVYKSELLINEILKGKSIALITDAGTPAISDPGYRIVKTAIENKINIVPLPGPTALIPALIASGFPTDEFHFAGFPPQKKGRSNFIKKAVSHEVTTILYESPYKIMTLIDELIIECGESRKASIAREISKIYEEFIRGSLSDCKKYLAKKTSIKGEFVIVLEGKQKSEE